MNTLTSNSPNNSLYANYVIRKTVGAIAPNYRCDSKRGRAFEAIRDGDTVGNWFLKIARMNDMDKVDISFLRFYEKEKLIELHEK